MLVDEGLDDGMQRPTLRWIPRLICLSVTRAKNRSTWFSHDESSTQSTMAFAGAKRKAPPRREPWREVRVSDSLNVFSRCGFSPKARHTRCTVETDKPEAQAMLRELQ